MKKGREIIVACTFGDCGVGGGNYGARVCVRNLMSVRCICFVCDFIIESE